MNVTAESPRTAAPQGEVAFWPQRHFFTYEFKKDPTRPHARLGAAASARGAARGLRSARPGLRLHHDIPSTTSQLTALTTDYPTKSLKVESYLITALMLSYLTFVLLSVLTFFIRMSQFFPL